MPSKQEREGLPKNFFKTHHVEKTPQEEIWRSHKNKLGLFQISNTNGATYEEVEKIIMDCAQAKRHLVIPQWLIVTFDGDIQKAAIMSFLIYMETKLAKAHNSWFVTKYRDIQHFTGASSTKIGLTIKLFKQAGIIEQKKAGIPAMPHYKIDHTILKDIIIERVLHHRDVMEDWANVI
jgi:hypothetical protein